eukprot:35139-Chlamydomonas_euryale.AAC.8
MAAKGEGELTRQRTVSACIWEAGVIGRCCMQQPCFRANEATSRAPPPGEQTAADHAHACDLIAT